MEIQSKSNAKYDWSIAFDVLDEHETKDNEICERAIEDITEEL